MITSIKILNMKQTIEIEVPEGKKAVWENNQIKFVDVEQHWESIKTFDDAYEYCRNHINLSEYITYYDNTVENTYEEKIAKLRLVIAALTNNEKLSLIKGDLLYPVIQFCTEHDIKKCSGNKIIGKIKTEGKEYLVVGGSVNDGSNSGLGYVYAYHGLFYSRTSVGFSCVSSRKIAEHLSTYFGKLIFEVMYGGSNCDWEWVE